MAPHRSHPHASTEPVSASAFIVTCTDSRDAASDRGGPLIRRLLEEAGHRVAGTRLVKDQVTDIRDAMAAAVESGARLALFTGGTGLARRDCTLEALEPLFEKPIPGFGELFRALSFEEIGSAAMMSRAAAGVHKGVAVFALPGSPAAVELAMRRLILPEVAHLVLLLEKP